MLKVANCGSQTQICGLIYICNSLFLFKKSNKHPEKHQLFCGSLMKPDGFLRFLKYLETDSSFNLFFF
jgi:hypothetical protein